MRGHPDTDRGSGRGQGFFDAPWWKLILWFLVLIIGLILVEYLGIL